MADKRTPGYPLDKPRPKEEITFKTYEYDLPFNYENIDVWRKEYYGGEFHGIELYTTNKPSPPALVRRLVPNQWSLLQTAAVVPPEAAFVEMALDIADMQDGEKIWVSDPFVGLVDDDWNANDDIPAATTNLLANPELALEGDKPRDWTLHIGQLKSITSDSGAGGGLSVCFEGAQISLRQRVAVKPFQRIVLKTMIKSNVSLPRTVALFPNWVDKKGNALSDIAGDCIVVRETEPIVRVAVIGSACTPPGWVTCDCEVLEDFYGRNDFVRCVAPVRFRQNGLWGMHLRFDQWGATEGPTNEEIPQGMIDRYPGIEAYKVKTKFQEFPFTGMSSAVFEIPRSKKVIIMGGSETAGFLTDAYPDDNHYSFRTLRITVAAKR